MSRFVAVVLLALAQGAPGPGDGPGPLIERLGSPRFAEREAAQAELTAMGPSIVPALRAARGHADPEVRARLAALLREAEARAMLEPTRVPRWESPLPAAELLARLPATAGPAMRLTWSPRAGQPHPVPPPPGGDAPTYWEALTLAESAVPGRVTIGVPDELASGPATTSPWGVLLLAPRHPSSVMKTDARGPFRTRVVGLHLQRSRLLDLGPDDPAPAAAGRVFQVQLQVLAEPRLFLASVEPPRVEEAIDDRGRALARPGSSPGGEGGPMVLMGSGGPQVATSIDLDLADPPGASIRSLRGVIPLVVAQRQDGPTELPLSGPAGAVAEVGGWSVTREAFHPVAEEGQMRLDLLMRPRDDAATDEASAWPDVSQFVEYQCEVVDGSGRPLPRFPQEIESEGAAFRVRLAIVADGADPARRPVALRLYELTRARHDLPFAFRDVPMP